VTWYRVHYRKGFDVVNGEAELARAVARKAPKVLLHEPAEVHTCSVCLKEEAWWTEQTRFGDTWGRTKRPQAGWSWFGSYQDRCAKVEMKFCSPECRATFKRPAERDRRCGMLRYEPDVVHDGAGIERWKALHAARREADPRQFPFPTFPDERTGNGWCRWCGEAVAKPARTWHAECLDDYRLHTDLDAQYRHLVKRDGWGCAIAGRGNGRLVRATESYSTFDVHAGTGTTWLRWSEPLQVDHVIPLWSVMHLPPDERRAYFGPDNLWLLGEPAHRKKTAAEASARAAGRIPWTSDQLRP
jgi:hypothetical protein